jgi:hypothetical protein
LVLYAEAGASWDAGRVRQRLGSVGVRRRLVPATRPDSGWAALTDSPHTVSGHLRHVFGKLSVNSRVDLARIAAGREAGSRHGRA